MISCNGNLKEVYLASKIWADDHTNQYPMTVSVTNGGAMESALAGAAYLVFGAMSNELSTPQILTCPGDFRRPVRDFRNLRDTNISYFINIAATQDSPNDVVFGDDNFIIDGHAIRFGISELQTNDIIEWSLERHRQSGNIALADGSVQQANDALLRQTMNGSMTNRLLIP